MDGVTHALPDAERAKRGVAMRADRRRRGASTSAQVGLQFCADRLVLARVVQSGRRIEIDTLRSLPANAGQRAAVLRKLKQERVFRGARLTLLLAPGQYDVNQVSAPEVPADELRDALRWQLRGALGYPPEEALLDCAWLPQPASAPARQTLLAVTARRSAVAEILAPLSACGLGVDAVDVPEFAQRNLARAVFGDVDTTHGWLSFDQDTVLLTLHCLGEVAFARRMLLPNTAVNADRGEGSAAHFVERVVLQVQRSLELFERQSGLPQVTHLAIGPHAHAASVAAELGEKAALRTLLAETSDLPQRAAAAAGLPATDAGMLAVLGAALRPPPAEGDAAAVQCIDLYRSEHTAPARSPWRVPAAVAAASLVAGLAGFVVLESQSLDAQRAAAAQLRRQVEHAERMLVAAAAPSASQAASRGAAEAEVAALEALAARLDGGLASNNEPFTEPLRALARSRTAGLWLTGIRLNNTGGKLVLQGKATDASLVPQWLAALRREPRFAGTALARIELQPAREPEGVVQFRIASEGTAVEAEGGAK